MITLKDSLDGEKTGDAKILVRESQNYITGEYSRDAETGDIEVAVDDRDDVPPSGAILLVLVAEDGESEYNGSFDKNGQFS